MPTIRVRGAMTCPICEWLVLESVLAAVLPPGKMTGRPRKHPLRLLIDGIRWRTRTGSPWRDVPAEYGPWQSVTGCSAAGSATAPRPRWWPRYRP